MPVAQSQQPRLWDPQTLFKIANTNKSNTVTCVGCAITKGRRCENRIGRERRIAAESLMNRLAFIEPRQIIEREITSLKEIAYHCLCVIHLEGVHGQCDSKVAEWVISLEEQQRRLEFTQARSETESSERDSVASTRVSRLGSWNPAVASSHERIERRERLTSPIDSPMTPPAAETLPAATLTSLPSVPPSSTSALADPIVAATQPPRNQLSAENGGDINTYTREEDMRINMQRELEAMRRTLDRLVGYIETHITESQRPREADTVVPVPVTLGQEQELPHSVSPVLESNLSQVVVSEPEPTPPPTIDQQQCLLHHASRRSIDEDCPICMMPMVNCILSELVWCKQECGRSVHKDCFEHMLEFTSSNMRCVYCRSSWPTPCSHDDQPPEEFEFWTQWDLRLDRFFDPQHHQYNFWDAAYETNLPLLFQAEIHSSEEDSEEVGISTTDSDYDADDES